MTLDLEGKILLWILGGQGGRELSKPCVTGSNSWKILQNTNPIKAICVDEGSIRKKKMSWKHVI
jgi:hypothetical protein